MKSTCPQLGARARTLSEIVMPLSGLPSWSSICKFAEGPGDDPARAGLDDTVVIGRRDRCTPTLGPQYS